MRFGRKRAEDQPEEEPTTAPEEQSGAPAAAAPAGLRAHGPWDSSEVDLTASDAPRVDLGSLVVTGTPGVELRLQVDQEGQQVIAVLLVAPDGAVELRPFAAPRNEDIWAETRQQIAAETARRGGTATESEGPYGAELQLMVTGRTPDGQTVTQPSRVVGIPGPRWLLRATFMGRPAQTHDEDGALERALREVVVVRGSAPMSPGEALPLRVPPGAKPRPQQ